MIFLRRVAKLLSALRSIIRSILEGSGLYVAPAKLGRWYLEKRIAASQSDWRRADLLCRLVTTAAQDGDELASNRAANDVLAIYPSDMGKVLDIAMRFEDLGKMDREKTLYLRVVNEPSDIAIEFKAQLRKHIVELVADK